jgi:2'-5' RNA ligase
VVARTAIVVEVPEAEPVVGDHYRRHTSSGAEGMPPHITLLIPFVDSVSLPVDEVADIVRGFEPFEFRLTKPCRFGARDVVLWLAPEPSAPFVAITGALVRAYPAYQPYEGAFDEVVPHLTVAVSRDPHLLDAIEPDVAAGLPFRARATAATIVHHVDGRWLRHSTLPLGKA